MEVEQRLSRFYGAATSVLVARHAVIDKPVCDEVMALILPCWSMVTAEVMVAAGGAVAGERRVPSV